MKIRCKFTVLSFILLAAILLAPAKNVYAAYGSYSEDVPYLKGLEFNMKVNADSNRGVLLDLVMKSKTVDYFTFKFDKLENVNYEDFNIVFDITLKSKLEDGSITTHDVTKSFDIVSASNPGAVNNLLMNMGLKDSYYNISMEFDSLVRLSPDCIATEKFVADNLSFTAKKVFEYNTVISQVDCYLKDKTSGEHGLISRFILTWDSDFRKALCTNVSFNLIDPVTEEILVSGSNSNQNGAYGYDSEGDNFEHDARNVLSSILEFFTDIPAAIVEFVTGFFSFTSLLSDLILVVFPFIPVWIVNVLLLMLFLFLIIAIYKLVQGWFG